MMFDILLYLYDTFLLADHMPDAEQLTLRLSAAGFEHADISEALDWLAALDDLAPEETGVSGSIRCYSEAEMSRLDTEGRGFIAFLESAGMLPPHAREWVIEQALALSETEVAADRVAWLARELELKPKIQPAAKSGALRRPDGSLPERFAQQ